MLPQPGESAEPLQARRCLPPPGALRAAAAGREDRAGRIVNAERIEKALAAAAAVDAGEIARRASAPAAIPALLDQAREQAIAAAL